jgi:hypothetical protein
MLWLVSRELDDGLYNGRWGRVKRRVEGAGLFLSLSLSLYEMAVSPTSLASPSMVM